MFKNAGGSCYVSSSLQLIRRSRALYYAASVLPESPMSAEVRRMLSAAESGVRVVEPQMDALAALSLRDPEYLKHMDPVEFLFALYDGSYAFDPDAVQWVDVGVDEDVVRRVLPVLPSPNVPPSAEMDAVNAHLAEYGYTARQILTRSDEAVVEWESPLNPPLRLGALRVTGAIYFVPGGSGHYVYLSIQHTPDGIRGTVIDDERMLPLVASDEQGTLNATHPYGKQWRARVLLYGGEKPQKGLFARTDTAREAHREMQTYREAQTRTVRRFADVDSQQINTQAHTSTSTENTSTHTRRELGESTEVRHEIEEETGQMQPVQRQSTLAEYMNPDVVQLLDTITKTNELWRTAGAQLEGLFLRGGRTALIASTGAGKTRAGVHGALLSYRMNTQAELNKSEERHITLIAVPYKIIAAQFFDRLVRVHDLRRPILGKLLTSDNPGGNSFTVFAKLRTIRERYGGDEAAFRGLWDESYLSDGKLPTRNEADFIVGSYEMILGLMTKGIDRRYVVHAYIDEAQEVFKPGNGRFTAAAALFDMLYTRAHSLVLLSGSYDLAASGLLQEVGVNILQTPEFPKFAMRVNSPQPINTREMREMGDVLAHVAIHTPSLYIALEHMLRPWRGSMILMHNSKAGAWDIVHALVILYAAHAERYGDVLTVVTPRHPREAEKTDAQGRPWERFAQWLEEKRRLREMDKEDAKRESRRLREEESRYKHRFLMGSPAMTQMLIDMDSVGANKASMRRVNIRVPYIDSESGERREALIANELQAYVFLLGAGALMLNADTKDAAELEADIIAGSRPALYIATQKIGVGADLPGIRAVALLGGGMEMREELRQQVLGRVDREKMGRFLVTDPIKQQRRAEFISDEWGTELVEFAVAAEETNGPLRAYVMRLLGRNTFRAVVPYWTEAKRLAGNLLLRVRHMAFNEETDEREVRSTELLRLIPNGRVTQSAVSEARVYAPAVIRRAEKIGEIAEGYRAAVSIRQALGIDTREIGLLIPYGPEETAVPMQRLSSNTRFPGMTLAQAMHALTQELSMNQLLANPISQADLDAFGALLRDMARESFPVTPNTAQMGDTARGAYRAAMRSGDPVDLVYVHGGDGTPVQWADRNMRQPMAWAANHWPLGTVTWLALFMWHVVAGAKEKREDPRGYAASLIERSVRENRARAQAEGEIASIFSLRQQMLGLGSIVDPVKLSHLGFLMLFPGEAYVDGKDGGTNYPGDRALTRALSHATAQTQYILAQRVMDVERWDSIPATDNSVESQALRALRALMGISAYEWEQAQLSWAQRNMHWVVFAGEVGRRWERISSEAGFRRFAAVEDKRKALGAYFRGYVFAENDAADVRRVWHRQLAMMDLAEAEDDWEVALSDSEVEYSADEILAEEVESQRAAEKSDAPQEVREEERREERSTFFGLPGSLPDIPIPGSSWDETQAVPWDLS